MKPITILDKVVIEINATENNSVNIDPDPIKTSTLDVIISSSFSNKNPFTRPIHVTPLKTFNMLKITGYSDSPLPVSDDDNSNTSCNVNKDAEHNVRHHNNPLESLINHTTFMSSNQILPFTPDYKFNAKPDDLEGVLETNRKDDSIMMGQILDPLANGDKSEDIGHNQLKLDNPDTLNPSNDIKADERENRESAVLEYRDLTSNQSCITCKKSF